ncbi:MAG: 2-succinyl-6-hydroxy-2,4-cyclohexadiene-1-carboxylate synthase [Chloroflexota bacterium]|nr:2-succinyl-6-hydroxy-2,4-cyclohexadiene-1-carboxylate synthase [Chloroflexota bacterium]MDE2909216.1 2-succinyl-6-hydroxy-2,4-cyclohexadiene-1-carboxylate synthase [Chloroflexota bacterium]
MKRYRAINSGHRYHIEIHGAGDRLVLLHGFSGDASTWRAIIERLADKFQLIAIDLLGHGASDAPADIASYRMEAVAADIVDLLDQLAVCDPYLLGYSMGGRLALFLACAYPSRFSALILESASPGLADQRARADRRLKDDQLADQIEKAGVASFVANWESLPLWSTQSKARIRAQRAQRLANRSQGLANSLRGMGAGAQPNLWRQLPKLNLPTCLIVGERDDKFRRINQDMASAIPRSRLSLIPAAGHNTHLEEPDAFCQAIRAFPQRR